LHSLCPHLRLDRGLIAGIAAIMGLPAIMGTAGTMGMGIRIVLVYRSARDGADGDQGGVRFTRIIHTIRTIRHPLALFRNSPRGMFNRISSRNPIIGTTVRILRAITRTFNSCPGGWMKVVPETVPPGR